MLDTPARPPRAQRVPLLLVILLLAVVALAATAVLSAGQPAANGSPATAAQPLDPLTALGVRHSRESPSNPSGVQMPIGNPKGWKEVFTDDFSQSVPTGDFSGCKAAVSILKSTCAGLPKAVNSQLFAYPDGWQDGEHGTYEPSKVLSIHNGVLDYHLHTVNGVHMVAAVEPKIPGAIKGSGLLYGAYAIRFKATSVAGYKTAFLLWPDSEKWPKDGEIDFPEGALNGEMRAAMHFQGGKTLLSQDVYGTGAGYTSWHTAVIEWTPTMCRFILDGRIIGTSTTLIPDTPMHWVLQAQTPPDPIPTDGASAHIYVAWITAYVPV